MELKTGNALKQNQKMKFSGNFNYRKIRTMPYMNKIYLYLKFFIIRNIIKISIFNRLYNKRNWKMRGATYGDRIISNCYNIFYQNLIDECIKFKPKTVLELGCGDGVFLKKLKEREKGISVFGYDFSETQLLTAKSQIPDGCFSLVDIRKIPNTREKFDVGVFIGVLMYLSPKDLRSCLLKSSKVMRYVIIAEMDPDDMLEEERIKFNNAHDGRHAHCYKAALLDSGFEEISTSVADIFNDPKINTEGSMGYTVFIFRSRNFSNILCE